LQTGSQQRTSPVPFCGLLAANQFRTGRSETILADIEQDKRMITSDLQIRAYVHNYSRQTTEKVTRFQAVFRAFQIKKPLSALISPGRRGSMDA
jgi:hypothetical protein